MRVWAHRNYSLDVHFSYWAPVCCFSPTWVSLGVHHWGDCSGWCLDYRQHLLFNGMADNTFFFFCMHRHMTHSCGYWDLRGHLLRGYWEIHFFFPLMRVVPKGQRLFTLTARSFLPLNEPVMFCGSHLCSWINKNTGWQSRGKEPEIWWHCWMKASYGVAEWLISFLATFFLQA